MSNESINNKDTNTDALFLQVRTAHRLLAAYYQRLLPTIELIASGVGTDFYFWESVNFSKPSRNPFKNWQWDMLPGEATRYVFKQIKDEKQVTKNDYIVEFIVINDTGINDEKYTSQPDALDLKVKVEEARSVLRVGIYRAIVDDEAGFYNQWESGQYPNYSDTVDIELDNKFYKFGFEVPLSQLMTNDGAEWIKERVMEYLVKTEEKILSESCEFKK